MSENEMIDEIERLARENQLLKLDIVNHTNNAKTLSPETIEVIREAIDNHYNHCYSIEEHNRVFKAQDEFNKAYGGWE